MAKAQTTSNPFYLILVIVGVVFVLTACSYFVMTLQGREESYGRRLPLSARPVASRQSPATTASLTDVMDRYGFALLMVELGVLAAATIAAIGTDEYWTRRAEAVDEKSGQTTDREELTDESEPSRRS